MNGAFSQAGRVGSTVQLQNSCMGLSPHSCPSQDITHSLLTQLLHKTTSDVSSGIHSISSLGKFSGRCQGCFCSPPAACKSYKGQVRRVPADQGESSYLHMILLTLILLQSAHFPTTHHIILSASRPISIYHLSQCFCTSFSFFLPQSWSQSHHGLQTAIHLHLSNISTSSEDMYFSFNRRCGFSPAAPCWGAVWQLEAQTALDRAADVTVTYK